jgi:general secretion pathway protein G
MRQLRQGTMDTAVARLRGAALGRSEPGGISSIPQVATFPINYPITRSSNYPIRVFESGFTLIELLIVVTLIIILSTMGMTQYRSSVIHTREATLKEDLFRLRDAIDQYYADKGQYPSGLDALVTDGYVRKVPEDPFTKSADTWEAVPAEPDPNNPTAEPGVYDVKSGSDGTALDGTKYAEW